ncbi:MAG: hypothetical protein LC750_16540, partial [Actinobacteria bacterium]|nr:hypothetical protein [Actinomycetota bacterium]
REAYPGGIFFVALGAVQDARAVLPAIAHAAGVNPASANPVAAIAERLSAGPAIAVLDTFEHLLEAASDVGVLLDECPFLGVLVTSREALRLRGEHEIAVPPLEIATDGSSGSVQASPATALFLERVRAVRSDFFLDDDSARIVSEICRRLSGLPLAIELAAARVKHLPLPALRDQLDHRLQVLTGGPRDLPPRQQTMRDTIRWSYELLGDTERELFGSLSVFAGGWSLESAEFVCASADALGGISALVDKSLVFMIQDGAPRYDMFDVIREYAAEVVLDEGLVRSRHAEYFARLAERAEPELSGPDQASWYRTVSAERENIRAAIQWAITERRAEIALRLAGSVWQFWRAQGFFNEGRGWLETALSLEYTGDDARRAKALWGAGWLAFQQQDYGPAEAFGAEFKMLAARMGDPVTMRNALTIEAMVALGRGRVHDALPLLQEGLDLCRPLGPSWHLGTSFLNLGMTVLHAGDPSGAQPLLDQARTTYLAIGDEHFATRSIIYSAYAALLLGKNDHARPLFSQCLETFARLGDKGGIAEALEGLAASSAAAGDAERAAFFAGAAFGVREAISQPALPIEQKILEDILARVRTDERAWKTAWSEGATAYAGDVIRIALAEP